MAAAKTELAWGQTSNLMCLLANANRDPKRTGPFKADDFNPTAKRRPVQKAPITVLRDVFIDKKPPIT